MIIRNGKEVIELYRGKHLVYQIIRSCFGSGYWINNAPFVNTDVWRNN